MTLGPSTGASLTARGSSTSRTTRGPRQALWYLPGGTVACDIDQKECGPIDLEQVETGATWPTDLCDKVLRPAEPFSKGKVIDMSQGTRTPDSHTAPRRGVSASPRRAGPSVGCLSCCLTSPPQHTPLLWRGPG